MVMFFKTRTPNKSNCWDPCHIATVSTEILWTWAFKNRWQYNKWTVMIWNSYYEQFIIKKCLKFSVPTLIIFFQLFLFLKTRLEWQGFQNYFTLFQIMLDFAYFYKSLKVEWPEDDGVIVNLKHLNLNPTLLVYVCLHTIYYLDILVFETTWITTFTSQEEGFGYLMGMLFSIAPFTDVLPIKYILDHKVHLAIWKLSVITAVFLFGYILCRASNNQKDAFRKNPYSPSLSRKLYFICFKIFLFKYIFCKHSIIIGRILFVKIYFAFYFICMRINILISYQNKFL